MGAQAGQAGQEQEQRSAVLYRKVCEGTVPAGGSARLADDQLAPLGNVVYEDLFAVLKGPQ